EAARERGDAAGALALYYKALAARLEEGDLRKAQRASEELEAEERDRDRALRVDRVVAALGEQDKQERARALATYVDFDAALRCRVRVRTSLEILEWIEPMREAGNRGAAVSEA